MTKAILLVLLSVFLSAQANAHNHEIKSEQIDILPSLHSKLIQEEDS